MKTVIFACVHSAGRSQMATAWFNHLIDKGVARAVAAGTEPADRVHPVAIEAMAEVGIDISNAKPQLLTEALVRECAGLITMGCGEKCPVAPAGVLRDDWQLRDPKGKPVEEVRTIRDEIKDRVLTLIDAQGWAKS
jgi:arsenate reductase (thioredoxin)